jgi:metal-responsive CopG/Arc/MetJ family transcriptional regulator
LVHKNIVKEGFIIARDRYLTIRISDKMLKEFEEALAKSEYSKSEIVRECIRKFIKKQKV